MQEHEHILSNEAGEIAEIDEIQGRRASLKLSRFLVLALICSFLASLAALWFSGTLLSAPDHVLPTSFLQALAAHRVFLLIIPAACLVVCYAALRTLTGEIIAVPVRYLDERQRMVRDQAQRSAFKIMKFACLLIPLGFLVPHLPWFNAPPAVAPVAPVFMSVIYTAPGSITWVAEPSARSITLHTVAQQLQFQLIQPALSWRAPFGVAPAIVPASTAEIALAGGLLLLCLFLLISALPMAVLAWKGQA